MDTLLDKIYFDFVSDFFHKKDEVIKAALIEEGFNPDDHDFLKANFQLIQQDGDAYEHLFYHFGEPDQKKIISIERMPRTVDDNIKTTLKASYYR